MREEDFINEVEKKSNLEKDKIKQVISSVLETIKEALIKGKVVKLVGFGNIETRLRKSRNVKIPGTDKTIQASEMRVVRFKTGKKLKELLNKKNNK